MRLDSSATALLIVDMQNDFVDPRGSLYVRGAETLIPVLNEAISRAQRSGVWCVFTQDWHPPHTPHFEQDGGIWPVHCVQESWGAAFFPALVVPTGSGQVRKGTRGEDGYSGFRFRDPRTGAEGETGLESLLRGRGVTRVVLGGVATDYCVKETALDAVRKGFEVTVLLDAIRPVEREPGDEARALAALREAGVRFEPSGTWAGA